APRKPSTVRTAWPSIWPSSAMQALIGSRRPSLRSRTTGQAPQSPSAPPSFVPRRPRLSRNQSSSVVIGERPSVSTGWSVERKRMAAAMQMTVIVAPFSRKPRASAKLRHLPPHGALRLPTTRVPDMDPYRFGYSPVVERPKLSWPGGARVAVWVCPNIEHYEYIPAEVRVRNPWPRMPHPDVLGYGGTAYGKRGGPWRMFEVLDQPHVA